MKELIKSSNGIEIYKENNFYSMYIDSIKVLTIAEQFQSMLDKSYDNLVQLRKKSSRP